MPLSAVRGCPKPMQSPCASADTTRSIAQILHLNPTLLANQRHVGNFQQPYPNNLSPAIQQGLQWRASVQLSNSTSPYNVAYNYNNPLPSFPSLTWHHFRNGIFKHPNASSVSTTVFYFSALTSKSELTTTLLSRDSQKPRPRLDKCIGRLNYQPPSCCIY